MHILRARHCRGRWLSIWGRQLNYIDSGSRNPQSALATWLQAELQPDITELRWQSGFFSVDGLHPFVATLQRLACSNSTVHVLVGSNDGETLQTHVSHLVSLMGLPRSRGRLGVVSFDGSLFHPKTYHLRRSDGSQAAYVGSANLSRPGIASHHVEAGILLDSRQGDPSSVLDEIAQSIDDWFRGQRSGLNSVRNANDVETLASNGMLAIAPIPRPPALTQTGGGAEAQARPRLQPLVQIPRLNIAPLAGASQPTMARVQAAQQVNAVLNAAVPITPPYPPYMLFAPGAAAPTSGASALTGASLPGGSVGLIIRLTRDSARHWAGGSGTSNITIPVPTLSTLRFGIYNGARPRPRCEFALRMRYLYQSEGDLRATDSVSNVMAYGFSPGDTGHGDVRLVVPKPPAVELKQLVQRQGHPSPREGDFAFLEWPTTANLAFRLTLLENGSPLFQQASMIFGSSQPVGRGACWLSPGLSPSW